MLMVDGKGTGSAVQMSGDLRENALPNAFDKFPFYIISI